MALIPSARYPAQIDTSDPAGYPQGKARNAGTHQDGTGTPLERDWLNDDWGFKQALLAAASVTPSGNADKVGVSQYLDALQAVATSIATARVNALAPTIASDVATPIAVAISALRFGFFNVVGAALIPQNTPYGLTLVAQHGGFTVESGNTVRLPSVGTYIAWGKVTLSYNSPADPSELRLMLRSSSGPSTGLIQDYSIHPRNSAITGQFATLQVMGAGVIADPANPLSTVQLSAPMTNNTNVGEGRLFILKLA